MPQVTGDITTFLDTLDQPEPASPVQALIGSFGSEPEVEEFSYGPGGTERYLTFRSSGVDLLVEGGMLAAVFLHLRTSGPSASYTPYGAPSVLVEGLPAHPTRDEVRATFGPPLRSSDDPAWDFFAIGPRFVNVAYEGDDATLVTLMVSDPTESFDGEAYVEGLEIRDGGMIEAPSGDVDTFMAAFAASSDDVLARIMLLTGLEPAMRHEKIEREGAEWLYVFLPGVDLQFKDGLLVGALIRVAREDGPNYRRLARLVRDLPLPAGRDDVRAALGTPKTSSPTQVSGESFDLYDIASGEFTAGQDLSLTFDYLEDQVVSLSVLRRGVDVA